MSLITRICMVAVIVLVVAGAAPIAVADVLDWTELIGRDAGDVAPRGLNATRASILAVKSPQTSPLATQPGHTKEEYLAGRARPVEPAPATRQQPSPEWIAEGSVLREVTFCDDIDQEGRPVTPRSRFPAGTRKIGLFYRYADAPDGTDLWVTWKKDDDVVSRALRRIGGTRHALHFVYPQQAEAIDTGLYRVEFAIGDRVEATIECIVGDADESPTAVAGRSLRDAVWGYYRALEPLRGTLSYALQAEGDASPALPDGAAEALRTLSDRYLDLAYLAYLLGPDGDNGLLEARAMATGGMLIAVHDIFADGKSYSDSRGRARIERATALVAGLPADRVGAFFGNGALAPDRLNAYLAALQAPSPASPTADLERDIVPSPEPMSPEAELPLTFETGTSWRLADQGPGSVVLKATALDGLQARIEWWGGVASPVADVAQAELERTRRLAPEAQAESWPNVGGQQAAAYTYDLRPFGVTIRTRVVLVVRDGQAYRFALGGDESVFNQGAAPFRALLDSVRLK